MPRLNNTLHQSGQNLLRLKEMGFTDSQENEEVLKIYANDIDKVHDFVCQERGRVTGRLTDLVLNQTRTQTLARM